MNNSDPSILLFIPVLVWTAEDTPERVTGAAEGRDYATGGSLRRGDHPRLCRKGGVSLAAAHAQDGGSTQTGQCFSGLLQDLRAGEGTSEQSCICISWGKSLKQVTEQEDSVTKQAQARQQGNKGIRFKSQILQYLPSE